MIIVLIILFAALTIYGFFYIKNKGVSWIVGVLGFILLALSMVGLVVHDNSHWGMKKVSTTTVQTIPNQMITAVKIGESTGNYVFILKKDASDKTASAHFSPDKKHIVEAVKKKATFEEVSGRKTTEISTKTTRWEWANDFAKTLFAVGGEKGELVKQVNTVKAPKGTVLVVTQAQAKKLQSQQAEIKASAEASAKEQVEAATKEAIAKATAGAPDAAKAEIAAQVEAKVQAQVAAKQKAMAGDPIASAKAQVTAIKDFLKK